MEDDSSEGVVDNVVKGPWKSPKLKKVSIETKKLAEDMMFIEDVAESVMIPLIHSLSENGVDIQKDELVAEVGFMNEVVKSMLFRHLGYGHPMTTLIGYTMNVMQEETRDTYAKFDMDTLDKILEDVLKEEEDEPDPA
tara:strand:- start:35 stop:448 length:414 start_codon:yes stop_codon:yes gene_type:complete